MNQSPNLPVLIVGAGPVGLTLACDLARRGVRTRLVDKLRTPTTESRAIIVHARSLEMLERIGVVEEVVATGLKVTAAVMHSGQKKLVHIDLNGVDSPYPYSVVLPQTDTERILSERLRALGGVVERGVELVKFDQDDATVTAHLRIADGNDEVAKASWIVGTDGSRSTVREQTGQRLEGSFKGERFVLADVEADHDLDRRAIHTFFPASGSGPLLAFPMVGTRMRLIAEVHLDTPADVAPTMQQVQAITDERAGGIALRSTHWITVFDIHHAQVLRYRVGRALLAGDAAHVHSPAGGQGMNTGMQDVFNLGWKLGAVASGADPALLDSYHIERHPIAERVIKDTTRLTNLATVSSPAERAVRNFLVRVATGFPAVRKAVVDETEETDLAYRDSPILDGTSARHGGPSAGEAAPDVAGLGEGVALHTLLAANLDHTVVHVAGAGAIPEPAPASARGPKGTRRLLFCDAPVDTTGYDRIVVDPDRRVASRYGLGEEPGIIVVRPDGYIGLITAEETAVERYFSRITTPQGWRGL